MTRLTSLVTCALALVAMVACGCGPEKSDAGTAPPGQRAGYQPTDGDRYYWACFSSAFQGGKGLLNWDGFCALPTDDVTDPLLVEIHNTWATFFEERQQMVDEMSRDPSKFRWGADPVLLGRYSAQLKPKVDRAKARYGVPGT